MISPSIRGVIGLIASMERFMSLADERDNAYLFGLLEKHHTRLKGVFDRHVVREILGRVTQGLGTDLCIL